ncbi:MAG: hypothetical protein AAFR05_17965, partial [Bacteroidota bacterium]
MKMIKQLLLFLLLFSSAEKIAAQGSHQPCSVDDGAVLEQSRTTSCSSLPDYVVPPDWQLYQCPED